MKQIEQTLRSLIVLNGAENADFNPEIAPEDPIVLFVEWLELAMSHSIAEPHAMTISTLDTDGNPDSRVLILKNIDSNGWYFAISKNSPKGKGIDQNPNVALTFYWQPLARQVRIKGTAIAMNNAINEHDFLSRSPSARAMALIGKQSETLNHVDDLKRHQQRQQKRIEKQSDLVSDHWTVYCVKPQSVEFWQGQQSRSHIRLRYSKNKNKFIKTRLWP